MANLRPSRLSPSGLSEAPAPKVPPARRWLMLGAGGIAALLLILLAWFDGGEEPLRPIAEPVELPEPAQ